VDPPASLFPTTQWTLVHLLHSNDDLGAAELALERLCSAYRSALYHYARASGLGPHDAEDSVQDFFAHVIGQDALKTLQKEKGRLRSWMIRSFNNRLMNRREHRAARKRGGGVEHVQWDFSSAEQEFSRHHHSGMDAAQSCDLALALGLWEATLRRLDSDSKVQKRPALYQSLRPHLLQGWPKNGPNQTEVAALHGLTANALRVRLVNLIIKARSFFISIARETIDPLISDEDLDHLWSLLK
jgi:DNA-directed RNA polymerase specialized sigma24 family protein